MSHGPLGQLIRRLRTLAAPDATAGLEDRQLLERFLVGRDESAFEALLYRHGPMVLGLCRRLLPDPCDTEDAFQATFLVLLRKGPSLSRPERLASWLYGVAHRTCLAARRRSARRRYFDRRVTEPLEAAAEVDPLWSDLRGVLDDELSRLPEKYRIPVILCYLEGQTLEAAARQLGWPAGTVSGRLARARELLRKRLTRRGLTLSAAALATALCVNAAAAVPAPLLVATTKTGTAFALAEASFLTSPNVAALVKGVLKTMLLTNVRNTLLVLLVLGGLIAGAGFVAYSRLEAQQPGKNEPKKEDAPKKEGKDEDRLAKLLTERVEVARAEVEARTQEFEAGKSTLDVLTAACKRLLDAEVEAATKQADRVTAHEGYLKRMKGIEDAAHAAFEAGRLTRSDKAQATYHRLEAEIWLERARKK